MEWSILVMGGFMLLRASASPSISQSFSFSASSAPTINFIVTAACTIAMMLGLMAL
jgi:hypothetical protein